MIEISGIDHIVLRTTQLEAMLLFYCQVLGCQLERQSRPEVGLTQLSAGNAMIDLVTVDSSLGKAGGQAPALTGRNLDHFCLQIKSVPELAVIEYLQFHGIETGDFALRYGALGQRRTLYICDPDGNRVELVSL